MLVSRLGLSSETIQDYFLEFGHKAWSWPTSANINHWPKWSSLNCGLYKQIVDSQLHIVLNWITFASCVLVSHGLFKTTESNKNTFSIVQICVYAFCSHWLQR